MPRKVKTYGKDHYGHPINREKHFLKRREFMDNLRKQEERQRTKRDNYIKILQSNNDEGFTKENYGRVLRVFLYQAICEQNILDREELLKMALEKYPHILEKFTEEQIFIRIDDMLKKNVKQKLEASDNTKPEALRGEER